ncbi:isovaleryl-CoA dehydrogenase [Pseudomonas sp. MT3]
MSADVQFKTHEVENQPLPMAPLNAWLSDKPLQEAVEKNGGIWAEKHLSDFGQVAGREQMEAGEQANRNKPVLHPFDRYGRRIDHVEFHPAYHELMRQAMRGQVHSFSWRHKEQAGAHVVRAALLYMCSQADAGTCCPLTMTHACIPSLMHSPEIAKEWIPRILATEYDPRTLPANQKTALTIGMGMTEKQGGSDVRRNTTRAIAQADGSYRIVGHKFFFSAPLCDAHLILAQAEGGLSCFLLPRVLPDGSLNDVRIQRLKDKLGDWSNASSEVEFQGATAHLIGVEGRGVPAIIEMVSLTRLDCMIGSTALMRQALVQALHHTSNREAFGRVLIEQPLMRNVLADLALECEASVALTLRVARAVDAAGRDSHEAAFARIATAIGKYWICKRTPAYVNEAQECLGGIGFVEENILPRLYRQAPLNSIWEGSGNVQCLDVLRALQKEPEVRHALFVELQGALGKNALYDQHVAWLKHAFEDVATLEVRSRLVVERAALAIQAALLLNTGDPQIAETFCRSRLAREQGFAYGTLDPSAPLDLLIARAKPAV